jgi:hypothetical protein
MKAAFEMNADQAGEMIDKIRPEMTWNEQLDAIGKRAPLDGAVVVVQRGLPNMKVWRMATVEVGIDVPGGIIAPRLSGGVREVIAVTGLRGGFRRWAWRTLRFEIGPTISRLSLAIIAISVSYLLRSSCLLEFPNSAGLMRRSRS